jgi:hypothetical protein
MRDNTLIKAWLREKVPFEALERRYKAQSRRMSEIWLEKVSKIKVALEQGGELWSFFSPPETWANMCGRAGYAVVRDGEVIEAIVTMMN